MLPAWGLILSAAIIDALVFQLYRSFGQDLLNGVDRFNKQDIDVDPYSVMVVTVVVPAMFLLWLYLSNALLNAARKIRTWARKITLQPASEVLETDSRRPVLFLRAFEHQQVPFSDARLPWYMRAIDPGSQHLTLEDMLVHELQYRGPVVTVADPSESRFPVGAARWSLPNEAWQSFVASQMRKAQLVVVSIAGSSGLQWEMNAIKEAGALARTIFFFPPGRTRDLAPLSKIAGTAFPEQLATEILEVSANVNILAYIPPREDGQPRMVLGANSSELHYRVALRLALAE